MYFINEEHQDNFLDMLNMFPAGHKDRQYKQACYIVAVPGIYRKAKRHINESPVDWAFDYLDGELDIDFAGSYRELIKCAVHLWNGHEGFSLYDGIALWDENNYRVFKAAVDIAKGQV